MSETADPGVKRHYWVAALLGLTGTGLGFVYVARPRLGLAILALGAVLPFSAMHFFGGFLPGIYSAFALLAIFALALFFTPLLVISRNRTLAAERRPKRWRYAAWFAGVIAFSVLWPPVMKPFLNYRTYNIPSGSMAPNVMPGDVIVVRQLHSKEQKASLTPGAVVIFSNQKDADEYGRPRDYLSRILATGGQTINFMDGAVILDGAALPQEEEGVRDAVQYGGATESVLHLRERLGDHSYVVLDVAPGGGPLDNVGPYQVPDGHYFMVGDNRDRAQDSRVISRVGYVPEGDVVGEALYVAFSTQDLSRIGKRLDR